MEPMTIVVLVGMAFGALVACTNIFGWHLGSGSYRTQWLVDLVGDKAARVIGAAAGTLIFVCGLLALLGVIGPK